MKKSILIGVAVLAIAGGGAALTLAGGPESQPVATSNLQQASFAVENMTCATCPITVRKAMEGVAGVSEVTTDFAAKTARATFDPNQTNADTIAAASTNAGYPARTI